MWIYRKGLFNRVQGSGDNRRRFGEQDADREGVCVGAALFILVAVVGRTCVPRALLERMILVRVHSSATAGNNSQQQSRDRE